MGGSIQHIHERRGSLPDPVPKVPAEHRLQVDDPGAHMESAKVLNSHDFVLGECFVVGAIASRSSGKLQSHPIPVNGRARSCQSGWVLCMC